MSNVESQAASAAAAVHPIRLRGPWRLRRVSRADRSPPATGESVIQVPDDLNASIRPAVGEQICLLRRFHGPPGLQSAAGVHLVIDSATLSGEVWLNETRIGQLRPGTQRFDLRAMMQPINELCIELDSASLPETSPAGSAAKAFDVRLEIG